MKDMGNEGWRERGREEDEGCAAGLLVRYFIFSN